MRATGRDADADAVAPANVRRRTRMAGLRQSIAISMRAPLLQRLLLTWALWVITEWAVLVVLSVAALDHGGIGGVAVIGVLRLVPAALTAPVAARVTARWPRNRVVAGAELAWVALLVGLAGTVGTGSAWATDALLVVASIASTSLRPSINALVPEIEHDPTRLAAVNATFGLVEAVASLIGPVLASAVLAATSASVTLVVLAALLAAGPVAAAGIRTERQPLAGRTRRHRSAAGLGVWLAAPALRCVYSVFLVQTLVRGILNVLLVAVAGTLTGAASGAGLLFATIGAGALIGALIAHAGASWPAGPAFILGMLAWGVPLLVLAIGAAPVLSYLALAMIGAANAVASVFGYTIVHRFVPDAALGGAFAVFWSSVWTATALGSLVAYGLVAAIGVSGSFAVAGGALVLAALAGWPTVRLADAAMSADAREVRLLADVPMLAPLSRIALEQLVRNGRRVSVRAGERVTVQGQVSDELFVVESGRLQAMVDGVATSAMGPGECFGEVAALRQSPRTATVQALSETDLLVIDGTAFVLAVTGHSRAERAAEELVRGRLGAPVPPAGIAG